MLYMYASVNILPSCWDDFYLPESKTSTEHLIKCLAPGHNTVPPVGLELATLLSQLTLSHCVLNPYLHVHIHVSLGVQAFFCASESSMPDFSTVN